ncbi:MAG: hypothetical protein AAF907_02400, partial [Planctomycetota bacterium]
GVATVQRPTPERLTVRAGGVATNFVFTPASGSSPIREDELTVKAGADLAHSAGASGWSAQLAGLRLESGDDLFTLLPEKAGGLSATLEGRLETLLARVRTAAGLPDASGSGDIRATAMLVPAEDGRWAVEDGSAELKRLRVEAPGLRLREEAATCDLRGTVDPATGTLAGELSWASETLNLTAGSLRFDPAETPAFSANLDGEGDAGRLWAWLPAAAATGMRPEGRLAIDGSVTGALADSGLSSAGFTGSVDATNLSLLTPPPSDFPPQTPWAVAWQEPAASLGGTVRYDFAAEPGREALHVGPLALTADGWSVVADGAIADPTGRREAALSGELVADWAKLSPRLAPRDGAEPNGVRLTGISQRPFTIRGPLGSPEGLASPDLTATAAVGWDELVAGGFSYGPGTLTANLNRGRAVIDGVDWPLIPLSAGGAAGTPTGGGAIGRLRTRPVLDFTGREPALRLPAGRILSEVRLTPEATRGWLGLVNPLAAGAVQADGAFDVDLDGAAAPLWEAFSGDLRRAGASGRLAIRRADFTAGPVADGLLGTVRDASALLRGSVGGDLQDVRIQLPAQSVPFRLSGGRVFHQNLQARSGSVQVATTGFVGLDGSLDLRAAVPLGRDLGGGTATVPIGGTLSAPKFDPSRIASAAATGAAEEALRRERERLEDRATKEIGRGLDRLFGRDK